MITDEFQIEPLQAITFFIKQKKENKEKSERETYFESDWIAEFTKIDNSLIAFYNKTFSISYELYPEKIELFKKHKNWNNSKIKYDKNHEENTRDKFKKDYEYLY